MRQMPLVTSRLTCAENGQTLCFSLKRFTKNHFITKISAVFLLLYFNNILLMYFSFILSKEKVPRAETFNENVYRGRLELVYIYIYLFVCL